MDNEQLELGINGHKLQFSGNGHPVTRNRQTRAGWWFAQMRSIVSRAMDWEAIGRPRPEQIWIAGAHREVKV